jgi:hypothetical protein
MSGIIISSSSTTDPPVIAKPYVDMDTLTMIDSGTLEDSYVYVHCHFKNRWRDMLIRIWKTTFLIDTSSRSRSKLLHAENITYAPQWTIVPDGMDYTFLLVFSGLPKPCTQFDLLEEISQPGGFFVQGISRNELDVYHINVD